MGRAAVIRVWAFIPRFPTPTPDTQQLRRRTADEKAAIADEAGAIDVAGPGRAEELDELGDVVRQANAVGGDGIQGAVAAVAVAPLVLAIGREGAGVDIAG